MCPVFHTGWAEPSGVSGVSHWLGGTIQCPVFHTGWAEPSGEDPSGVSNWLGGTGKKRSGRDPCAFFGIDLSIAEEGLGWCESTWLLVTPVDLSGWTLQPVRPITPLYRLAHSWCSPGVLPGPLGPMSSSSRAEARPRALGVVKLAEKLKNARKPLQIDLVYVQWSWQ